MGADPRVQRAQELYNRTEYEAALRTLAGAPQNDAAANSVIGRAAYILGDFKAASEALERAAAAEPGNSDHYLWLGRAYGRRAELANWFTAPGLARKTRRSFEKAVELDARNLEAVSDLFEYYLEAPGIMGGGFDKAVALAERARPVDPAEYHYLLARAAEKRKEYRTAEHEFRMAIDAAPRQVGRVVDLAKFLAGRGRYQESDDTFRRAETIAPNSAKVIFERASLYIRTGRNLDLARLLLRRYLNAQLTPDDPPRGEAERLLKRICPA